MAENKKLKDFLDKIEKNFGKDAISKTLKDIKRVSSGSIGLDLALGGGYPVGKVTEIYGPESSGKTTLMLHFAAEVQKLGGRVAYIDTEHALDLFYAASLGVDVDIETAEPKFFLSQPDNAEQALGLAREFVNSGLIDLVVVDSVASLVAKATLAGEVGDAKMALIARLMATELPVLVGAANRNNCSLCFVNQIRMLIGVMFGSPETTPGGQALKFAASVRLDIRKIGVNKEGEESVSNRVRVKTIKNKTAPPFRKAEFDIVYGEGISKESELVDAGVDLEIIKKSGSWYSYGETKLGQGKPSVVNIFKDNPELAEEIELKVRQELGLVIK